MLKHYKLDGKSIVECKDFIEWAIWFEIASRAGKRHVAFDEIGLVRISTVFLGMDHGFSFDKEAAPVLFETMVFVGRWSSEEMRRYCTYEEAEAGHAEIVKNIKRHPWSRIVLPSIKFFVGELRSAIFRLGNKILAWIWPAILKAQSVVRYLIDKIRKNQ